MSGGSLISSRRSFAGVSPVRTATRTLRLEPGERAAQVALDVVVERLQRRDVEDAQPVAGRLAQAVERVQERGERLSAARRRLDQDVRAGRDRGPAELLRRRRPGERALEPARAWSVRRQLSGIHSARVACTAVFTRGRMTYSILGRDPETGELGVAVQSQAFNTGAAVPWARPGVGVDRDAVVHRPPLRLPRARAARRRSERRRPRSTSCASPTR